MQHLSIAADSRCAARFSWLRAAVAALAVFALAAGCTAQSSDYCDNTKPCPSAQQCNPQTFTCQPIARVDAGVSVGPDGATGDAEPTRTKMALGARCDDGAQCQSGFCADGVCCNSACDGTCRTCSGERLGECALVGSGADPRGDCAGSAAECAGSCDGAGACRFPGDSTSCGADSCSAGSLETHTCDSQGGCATEQTLCDGFACAASGDACKTRCTSAGDCSGTYQCVGGACVNQLPAGSACGSNDKACASGHCVDGVCCGSASCAACNRCDVAGSAGTCAPVADGTRCGADTCDAALLSLLTPTCKAGACTDVAKSCGPYTCDGSAAPAACRAACTAHTDCAAGSYCDAAKACVAKKADGQSCNAADQCQSGFCVKDAGATSGVCCNRACGGGANVCESCSVAGKVGTCSYKPAGTRCGGADVCADNATARSSAITRQQCSGASATCSTASIACAAGAKCNGAKTACAASCSAHSQCWQGICDLWDIHGNKNHCAAPADTCHVSAGASGNGSYAAPYGAIQTCLDAQKKYVRVNDGTYTESLVVKAPVALVAPSSPSGAFANFAYTGKVIVQSADADPALLVDADQIVGATKRAVVYGVRFTLTSASTASHIVAAAAARLDLWSVGAYDGPQGCILGTKAELVVRDSATSGCDRGFEAFVSDLDIASSQAFLNKAAGVYMWGSGNSLVARDVNAAFNFRGIEVYGATVDIDRAYTDHNTEVGLVFGNGARGVVTNLASFNNFKQGVYADLGASVDFGNVTVAFNNGANPDVTCSGGVARFVNSIVWDSSGDASSGCSFEHSTIKTAPGVFTPSGAGNSSADPLFIDGAAGNFGLQASSPCIDSGSDSGGSIGTSVVPTLDLAKASRKVKVGATSATIDRGAFERQAP